MQESSPGAKALYLSLLLCYYSICRRNARWQRKAPNLREIKDSVFTDLFGKDRTARGNFISLYNALHGTSLRPEETELLPETLDRIMYMSYANDVAM